MPQPPIPQPEGPLSPLESLRAGVRHRQLSARGASAWWLLRMGALGSLFAAALVHLPGAWGNVLGGTAAMAALLALLRFTGLQISLARWWKISFGVVFAGLLLSFSFGLGKVVFIAWVILFLGLRRHRIHRQLRSRQRAATFFAAMVLTVAWILAPASAPSSTWMGGLFENLRSAARFGLLMFWVSTAVWLVLRARLHFLRLRPKVAVISLLVAEIPILLLLLLSAIAIFGFLGGSRASQGSALVNEWVQAVGRGELSGNGPFDDAYGQGLGSRPAWADSLDAALAAQRWDPVPPASLVTRDDELWLVKLQSDDQDTRAEAAYRFSARTAQRMSSILRCEVSMALDPGDDINFRLGGEQSDGLAEADSRPEVWARPAEADSSEANGWLDRWLHFGAVPIEAQQLDGRQLTDHSVVLVLKVRPKDLLHELAPQDNDIHQAIAVALVIVAVIFVLLQLLAVLFGMRIVGGVTSAVKTLHKATEDLARGELDTWIEVPNEDEFGDLASSFNEMTRAIELGQEQSLQREVLEREVLMARRIQERLLPSDMPEIDGYEVSASSDPSRQVGGDYFDFLEFEDGRWGFAVGDVTGKGVPAALLMSNVQASLHGQAMHPGSVAATVERMNGLLAASTDAHMFVTFFYGILEPRTGEILCTNAGHEPPIILRRDGSVDRVRSGGLILGMLAGQNYAEHRVVLDPGDMMVLFTDGVTEATGPGHVGPEGMDDDEDDDDFTNFFEEDRLLEVVRQSAGCSADEVRRRILSEVSTFTEGTPQSDDITLLVLRRREVA